MKSMLTLCALFSAGILWGAEEGFESLFNGKDLSGWYGNKEVYYVSEPGVMACGPREGVKITADDYLMTVREFADFVIRFDFKCEEGADNGLGIRWPQAGDMAYTGIEMQLADTAKATKRTDLWRTMGGFYGVSNARDDRNEKQPIIGGTYVKKCGEWNAVELWAQGTHITAYLNGVKVNECDLSLKEPTTGLDHHSHAGVKARKGHIVWWVGGTKKTVWWRNIRIRELNAAANVNAQCRRFIYSDFMNRKVVYWDEANPAAHWEAFLPEIAFDLTRSGFNHFVASQRNGWRLYDLGQLNFVREVKDPEHIRNGVSATRFPDGRTFVLDQGGTVQEYDAADKWVREYTFPKVVNHCRIMRFTKRGTALIGSYTGFAEVKLDPAILPEARLIKWFQMPAGTKYAYQAECDEDGSVWATGGYLPEFIHFAANGAVAAHFVAPQPTGLENFFYGGFARRLNGNFLVTNWTGHSGRDFRPGLKLLEFTPKGEVVWSWNAPWAGTPCAVISLD